jgi:hypothetical protein
LNAPVTAADLVRALPDPPALRDRCRALAMLDAIVCPDVLYRYYFFGRGWLPDRPGASAMMRNGCGDEYDIVFEDAGVFVRGLWHEAPMTEDDLLPELFESVPEVFAPYIHGRVFTTDDEVPATVVVWRQAGDDHWAFGDVLFPDDAPDPDGSTRLFSVVLDGTGAGYQQHVEEYHERPLDMDAVRALLALTPLTEDLVRRLNPDVSLADLAEDLADIGYPVAEKPARKPTEPVE